MKVIIKLNEEEKTAATNLYNSFNNSEIFNVDREYVFRYINLKDGYYEDLTLDQLISILNALSNNEFCLEIDF